MRRRDHGSIAPFDAVAEAGGLDAHPVRSGVEHDRRVRRRASLADARRDGRD
jgi:hypothetical protein